MTAGRAGKGTVPAGRLFALLAAFVLAVPAGIAAAEEPTVLFGEDEMVLNAPEIILAQFAADRYDLSVDGRRMEVRNDPLLPGRGQAGPDGNEPNYVGVVGFAVIPNDPAIGRNAGFADPAWQVPVYRQPREGKPLVQKGSVAHKTSMLVVGQDLQPDGKGGYTGWLCAARMDNRTMCYLDVSCFVTEPYWSLPVQELQAQGYGIAVFRDRNGTEPKDGNGETCHFEDGTEVLIPFEGAFPGDSPEPEKLDVQGVVFVREGENVKSVIAYFSDSELIPVY